jgi:hypothetical protein
MRRSFNQLAAATAATFTLAGCGVAAKQPPAIDGCNIPRAKSELRADVIDGKNFVAPRLGSASGKFIEAFVQTPNVFENNPLILTCKGVIKAFAGINTKALHTTWHNKVDPVVVIPGSEAKGELDVVGSDGSQNFTVVDDMLRFDRKDFGDNAAQPPAFTNAAGHLFGQSVEVSGSQGLLVLPLINQLPNRSVATPSTSS